MSYGWSNEVKSVFSLPRNVRGNESGRGACGKSIHSLPLAPRRRFFPPLSQVTGGGRRQNGTQLLPPTPPHSPPLPPLLRSILPASPLHQEKVSGSPTSSSSSASLRGIFLGMTSIRVALPSCLSPAHFGGGLPAPRQARRAAFQQEPALPPPTILFAPSPPAPRQVVMLPWPYGRGDWAGLATDPLADQVDH